MGRKQIYSDERLKELVEEYAASMTIPTVIRPTDVARYANEKYNFSPPLECRHFSRRPAVMEHIKVGNDRLFELTSQPDEHDTVIPDYALDLEAIVRESGDELKLRKALAEVNERIAGISALVYKHQKAEYMLREENTSLKQKVTVLEDSLAVAEKKAGRLKEMNLQYKAMKRKLIETEKYLKAYTEDGLRAVLTEAGRFDGTTEGSMKLPEIAADTKETDIRKAVEHYVRTAVLDEDEGEDPFLIADDESELSEAPVYSKKTGDFLSALDDL